MNIYDIFNNNKKPTRSDITESRIEIIYEFAEPEPNDINTQGVAEAMWDPWTGGDFSDTHDMNHLPGNDAEETDREEQAKLFKAMIQYYSNNILVTLALDDLYRVTLGGGYWDLDNRTVKYLATIEDQRTGKTEKRYFKNKQDAYRYATTYSGVITNLEKIDNQEDTSDLITLPVILGVGNHKKKWMLKFPSEDYAQKWEFKHRNAAKIQWPAGHGLAEDQLDDLRNNPWHVTDVDTVSETDFEVVLQGPNNQQLNFIIRPIDFIEQQHQRFQIDSMDVRDLQSGKTMHWFSGDVPDQWLLIFDAIDTYFWMNKPLQKQLRKIIDYYLEGGEQGKEPDHMPGLPKDVNVYHSFGSPNAIPADRFIKAHQDMKKVTGQDLDQPGVSEEAGPVQARAVDAKGRTQQEWMALVKSKFPTAKIMQAKMIDGPCFATLPDGKKISWTKVDKGVAEGKLNELFNPNSSYPIETKKIDFRDTEVSATTQDGRKITCLMRYDPRLQIKIMSIDFNVNGQVQLTGQGDATKILTTVVEAVKKQVAQIDPEYLIFLADSQHQGIYSAMARRLGGDYQRMKYRDAPAIFKYYTQGMDPNAVFILHNTTIEEQGVAEGDEYNEYSDEVDMVENNLLTIIRACKELANTLKSGENLPEWVEEKISMSKQNMVTVSNYLQSQHDQGHIYDEDHSTATGGWGQAARPAIDVSSKLIGNGHDDRAMEAMLPASVFAGSKKNKLGPAGQWRNKGPKKNSPARAGDLVGGAAESIQREATRRDLDSIYQSVGQQAEPGTGKAINLGRPAPAKSDTGKSWAWWWGAYIAANGMGMTRPPYTDPEKIKDYTLGKNAAGAQVGDFNTKKGMLQLNRPAGPIDTNGLALRPEIIQRAEKLFPDRTPEPTRPAPAGSVGTLSIDNVKNMAMPYSAAKRESSENYLNRLQEKLDREVDERSVSQAQAQMMAAAAHNPAFAKKVGIKTNVAKEFNRADTGKDISKLPKRVLPKKRKK